MALFVFLILFFLCDNCKGVSVSSYTKQKIEKAIDSFVKDGSFKVTLHWEWPSSFAGESVDVERYMTPGIMIWDVLRSFSSVLKNLICPFCSENQQTRCLRHSGLWTNGAPQSRYEPRLIYDSSSSFLLVSAVYVCQQNHQVPTHHPSVISSLPSSYYNTFYLTSRAGFSVAFLSEIAALVDHGTSFHAIEEIVHEQYQQAYWRIRLRFENDCSKAKERHSAVFPPFSQETYPFLHEKIIKNLFSSYTTMFLPKFHADMACRTSSWISCDHTFKSAANIGFFQSSDGSWIRLFNSLFCVLGEKGDVLHWRFTRGESFKEVNDIFLDLKKRFVSQDVNMEGIIIDNCCKWRGMFSSVFPGVPVKLDLFHAVQRFLSSLR
jgi:hypothetical protein